MEVNFDTTAQYFTSFQFAVAQICYRHPLSCQANDDFSRHDGYVVIDDLVDGRDILPQW